MRLAPLALIALAAAGSAQEPAASAPDWGAVRDVLERRCLECHGRDAVRSELRFADAATFAAGGARGPVFDADDPGASRLLAVIGYEDPDLAMPPSGALPDAERDVLERWVLAGAPWPDGERGALVDPDLHAAEPEARPSVEEAADWWAYRPLVRPAVPAGGGAAHPIDAFLRARRDATGLEAAPMASPTTLLRRATFGLTGLPPTPDERAAFLGDVDARGLDAAWSDLLDRLLARPEYAEHQARLWLDLVRYAETNGYERDATKTNIWRYRDWVIRSFHADQPYDEFVVEQLAGDELVGAGRRVVAPEDGGKLVATGYFRLGAWDDEPADREQAAADELADIADTTGQVFLGTTMGCARCHDHKKDPIRHVDYYAFTAWFNNLQGYGGDKYGQSLGAGLPRAVPDPPGEGVWERVDRAAELAALDGELEALAAELDGLSPTTDDEPRRDLVGDARARGRPGIATWRYRFGEAPDGWAGPAFDDSAWAEGPGGFGTSGTPGAIARTTWDTELVQLRTTFRLEAIPARVALSLHHDDDVAVFLNGQLVHEAAGYRTDYVEVPLGPRERSALVVGRNVLAVHCRQGSGGQYVDAGLFVGPVSPKTNRARLRAALDAGEPFDGADEARRLLARRERVLREPTTDPYPALIALERGGVAPDQYVNLRGSAHALGERVDPAVPLAFRIHADAPAVPAPDPARPSTGRRLALARWMVGDGAFLAARVAANRLWQRAFGRGLCRSPGDFGRLGEEPTHPELLDWLAVELVERGWSRKAMLRLLMTSDAYRMASEPDERALRLDPRNDLYARFDPRRLTAEEYRDALLATNGTLSRARFGPSVYPPLPAAVLGTASRPGQAWGSSTPEEAARRSVYVFAKRSLRPPLFAAFDQPEPDLPCPERFPTNVPTQALMTMNGELVHGAAERLAERLEREAEGTAARVALGIELALGRAPGDGEVERQAELLASWSADGGPGGRGALRLWCLGLYNRNEFLWLD